MANHLYRHALPNIGPPRPYGQQPFYPSQLPPPLKRDDTRDGDDRIAHTLTACCRCRLRKTRCDPTLPRCMPCERAGSTCEYLDTSKGRKINRNYVIKLQDKVKALEAELAPYIDNEQEDLKGPDDRLPPADLIRLSASDGTTRFLGPSSGILMTRLLVDEAKRFTESTQISELMPELQARRQARMQSIQMTGIANRRASRKKSYPMMSDGPAENLPNRHTADKLLDIFTQKDQLLSPVLHEPTLRRDLDAVYEGDPDPYKNFIVRMVIAISLQKVEAAYAGLADSFYLAAMQNFEEVVRPKDLRTLQCLVLTGQYSFLTPTRSSAYYVVGLATKICQRMGYTDEQTITTSGYNLDPLVVDLRKRVVWSVITLENDLAHSMGRPSGFATGHDLISVDFFATVDDESITKDGIQEGPPVQRKLMSIHMCKLSLLQAEINRTLYEKKNQDPKNDAHPWYQTIEKKLEDWHQACPSGPEWCKAWITGWYHQLKIFLYRPSPQVPQPSPTAAKTCFESSAHVIRLSQKQFETNVVDISWLFILTLTTALNTLLWTTSFPEVRAIYTQESVEELVDVATDVLEQSAERWPGALKSSQLYAVFAKACLQSYNPRANAGPAASTWTQPPIIYEPSQSPDAMPSNGQQPNGPPSFNPPQFGNVFDSPPEAMNNYSFDPNFPPQPTFRSNSIFQAPATSDSSGRRFSYFPPEFTQMDEVAPSARPMPSTSGNELLQQAQQQAFQTQQQHQHQQQAQMQQQQSLQQRHMQQPQNLMSSPPTQMPHALPTPPDSHLAGNMSGTPSNATLSPNALSSHAPNIMQSSGSPSTMHIQPSMNHEKQFASQIPRMHYQHLPPVSTQPAPQQRPLPTTDNWFSDTGPFMSPDGLGGMTNTFFGNGPTNVLGTFGDVSLGDLGATATGAGAPNMDPVMVRQGSLTQTQQIELMNVLETEGLGDIDSLLNNVGNMADTKWF